MVCAFCAVVLAAHMLYGADEGAEAVAWNEADQNGGVSFSSDPDGLTTVSFAFQRKSSPSTYSSGSVQADIDVSAGAFAGNYTAAGIEGLTFRIAETGVQVPRIMIILRGTSGRIWRNENIEVSESDGEWTVNIVGFKLSDGWTRDGPGDKAAMWSTDLASVEMIGVRVAQTGFEAQSYSIDDFILLGLDFDARQAILSLMESTFGVQTPGELTAEQSAQDSDGDGATDVHEIYTGTNPNDPDSVFELDTEEVEEDSFSIIWPCTKGLKYTVLRCTNLVNSSFTPIVTGLEAQTTGYMTYKDDTVTGKNACFYKVNKE
ncbi:thrombospondin type 3 repeat-containing protein [Verrucomicrobiota bacterium]